MLRLASRFVLAADEVWRLQGGQDAAKWRADGGTDPECVTFQKLAAQGHYGPAAGSKQGFYVCTPSGEFLASVNSHRALEVTATLRRGLSRWRKLSSEARRRQPKKIDAERRFEWLFPKGGTALLVTMRYLPRSDDPRSEKDANYNHDYLWFSAAESRQWFAAKPEVGDVTALPDALFQRLARLNLVDAVRGETRSFPRVSGSLKTRVTSISDGVVSFQLTGQTEARNTSRRRRGQLYAPLGIRTQLLGHGEYDLQRRRFVELDLLGKGVRWTTRRRRGRNRRDREESQGFDVRGIGWHFGLMTDGARDARIAPAHIREYEAGWAR